jgi:hypothetical protein
MRLLAQARNPYSLSWLWIPGSRKSAPRNDDSICVRKALIANHFPVCSTNASRKRLRSSAAASETAQKVRPSLLQFSML